MENVNDKFITAIVEYSVSEKSATNAFGTLLECVLSEFIDGLDHTKVKDFLKKQEKSVVANVGPLPKSYRSGKSTILSAIKYGVSIHPMMGKSEMYDATKTVKDAPTASILKKELYKAILDGIDELVDSCSRYSLSKTDLIFVREALLTGARKVGEEAELC